MNRRVSAAGFSLLETMTAMVLVAMAMTGLVLAFAGSGKFGVLSRRQANAVALGRSIAGQLNFAAYTDPRLVNNNTQNDVTFADPNGLFAGPSLPGGNDAPDSSLGTFTVGNESYDVYVNVSPQVDATTGVEQGRQFAVIVRYHVGDAYRMAGGAQSQTVMRAVILGYRYNPVSVGVGQLPL